MGRSILSVVVGYIVMAVCVMVQFTVAFMLIGSEKTFQPDVYDVTPLWLSIMFAGGLIAGIAGGVICSVVAKRGSRAPMGLVGVVVVLGSLSAVMQMLREDPGPRDPTIPVFEAANQAKQPTWVAWAFPVIGVAGTMIGASITGRCKPAKPVAAE